MNRRRVLAIVAAVLLTLFGTVVLIAFVNSAERRAQEGAELVGVLVATEEIPAGTPAADIADVVRRVEVPESSRADDAVIDLEALGGQVTLERILGNEPIVARHFGDEADAQRAGAGGLEEGREIISISLDAQRALGGQLSQGDLVGVIVSFESDTAAAEGETTTSGGDAETKMILTGVRVTDVTGGTGAEVEAGAAGQAVTVSLDVDEEDAEAIAFGMEFGRLWLTRQAEGNRLDDQLQTRDRVLGLPR